MKNTVQPTPIPEVGMAATVHYGSDSHAATVIAVRHTGDGKISEVDVRGDHATVVRPAGPHGDVEYTYAPNPSGRVNTFRWHRDRWWRVEHETHATQTEDGAVTWSRVRPNARGRITGRPGGLSLGRRRTYYDPHV